MSKKNKYPFVVGDIIKGKKDNGYAFTNEDMTKAKVVSVYDEFMEIEVVEYNGSLKFGKNFDVKNNLEDFDYFYPFKKGDMICGTEKSNHKYGVTNKRMIRGVVIDVMDNGYMGVKILEHEDDFQYCNFTVENSFEYFKFYGGTSEPKTELVFDKTDLDTGILITTDHKKNVTVVYKEYQADSNYNLECGDKFNYEFGLGLALERLGKQLQEQNDVSTATNYKAKILQLFPLDEGCGLHEGDIVDVVDFVFPEHKDSSCVYVRCKKTTFDGVHKSKNYGFPVQMLGRMQFNLIKPDTWKKSDKPTNYVRILSIKDWLTEESGLKKGDVVKVLEDKENSLYVEALKKNSFFDNKHCENVNTDYFTFLFSRVSAEWEYVTK